VSAALGRDRLLAILLAIGQKCEATASVVRHKFCTSHVTAPPSVSSSVF